MKTIKHEDSRWGDSLRRISWDGNENLSLSRKLISSTIHEWYDAKHRKSSDEEVGLINSVKREKCPLCGSVHFKMNGKYSSGIVRYFCNGCRHSFSPLTGTIFAERKIPVSEWIEYLMHLFEFHSLATSSRDNRNASSTGKYWLFKVFEVLKDYQKDTVLSGSIIFDETFFTLKKSDKHLKEDGKEYRGISRNKLCVAAAKDENGRILLLCENTSKPSKRSTWATLGNHIEQGSHLVHDDENSHSILVKQLRLSETVYKTEDLKKLEDKDNPLKEINEIHNLAKRFMRAHGGYKRADLQDWMNLVSFILSNPEDRYEKIDMFINMTFSVPSRVKYRDVMCKKSSI